MKRTISLALVALVATAAGAVALVNQDSTHFTRTYLNPTVDGSGIDIRYDDHMHADPQFTATRFCMQQGYSGVVDYSVRTAASTVTLGDEQHHRSKGQPLTAFSLIACGYASDLS